MMNNIVIALYLAKLFGVVLAVMLLACLMEQTRIMPSMRRWLGAR